MWDDSFIQLDLFGDVDKQKFIINSPTRLIELFGGYGSQSLSLKYLGVKAEHWRLCEWAIKSIQAYKDIHFGNDNYDYSCNLTDEQVFDFLASKGISRDYNKPMDRAQIKRLGKQQARTIYNNIVATHNLVNIQQVSGNDLGITETGKYTYIMTYSFPCQDLSMAGLRKGMDKGKNTRSGMLWEVERILKEIIEKGQSLPQVLLMENVPQVHGTKNIESFNAWCDFLKSIGYSNYWKDLNAKDYGIPQSRNRCFMVSILGDERFEFPPIMPLDLKLCNLLESNVDEKYYLTNKQINDIKNWKCYEKPLERIDGDICGTLTTRSGAYAGGMKLVSNKYAGTYQYSKSDNFMKGKDRFSPDKNIADCIQTTQKEGVVYINSNLKEKLCNDLIANNKVKEYDVIRHSYSTSRMNKMYIQNSQNHNCSPTLDTRCDCLGVCLDYRIRKLTPKECFRLMGVKDEDFYNVRTNQSDMSLYHLAGDSIVTTCLMSIFGELLGIDYKTKINKLICLGEQL